MVRFILGSGHRFADVHEFTARVGLRPIGFKSQVFPGRAEPAEVVFGLDELHPEVRFLMRVDPVRRIVQLIGDHADDLARALSATFETVDEADVRARLRSDTPEIARLAAWQLADLGTDANRFFLEDALFHERDEYVLDGILRALESIGAPESARVLRRFSDEAAHPLQARWLAREIAGQLKRW